uniref:Ribosomal protein S11 n=1 Tax=Pleurocladia lacustris TaxID=246121 RepID=A0A1I9LW98_9PHAE|nr:ribosomal protein S11 [Pleurocladia lacustris]ANS57826.1 ribosomal protein S11 [Pleurocladia lacustris]ANS57868.1 ribosomal protein S11 [Pleurocladia lacustris]
MLNNHYNLAQNLNEKKGNIYITSTKKNIFCTLMDVETKKIKFSCSLKVPQYENEFNERESPLKRGLLLGEVFGNKVKELGYIEVFIHLDFTLNKARTGIVTELSNKLKIRSIQVLKSYSHNGCRPAKVRRKKIRTKPKR